MFRNMTTLLKALAPKQEQIVERPRSVHSVGIGGGNGGLNIHHVETAADRHRHATIVARELGPMGINQQRRAGTLNRTPRRSVRRWRSTNPFMRGGRSVDVYRREQGE